MILVSGVQYSDLIFYTLHNGLHGECSYHLEPCSYYIIIDYITYAVHYIPVTYLFYNWKLNVLISLTYFIHPIICLSSNKHFVMCAYRSVSLLLYLFIFWIPNISEII